MRWSLDRRERPSATGKDVCTVHLQFWEIALCGVRTEGGKERRGWNQSVVGHLALPVCWGLLTVLALAGDYVTGPRIQFPILYLVPIALASWYSGHWWWTGSSIAFRTKTSACEAAPGKIGDVRAMEPLSAFRDDKDQRLCAAAREALRRISEPETAQAAAA